MSPQPVLQPDAGPAAQTAQIFVQDPETAAVIRQSLNSAGVTGVDSATGNIVTATTALAGRRSPRLLIVDISGFNDPLDRLDALADVCEPNTSVVVVGDRNDIALYRNLRHAGVAEYFFKPLVGDLVTRTVGAILKGESDAQVTRSGRLVFMLGARGGVGATTIAVNTAWHLAESRQRLVAVVDLDLQWGDAALQLDVTPTHALREAFEHPERVDKLFIERAAIHVGQRIDLLASQEPIGDQIAPDERAVRSLLDKLLTRYRFVVVDLPAALAMRMRQTLHMPSTCVLISDGSLVSARDVARWREWIGANTPDRTTIHLLNQHGMPGSLPDDEFARAAGHAPDIRVPYERDIRAANVFGIKSAERIGPWRRSLAPLLRDLSGEQAVVQPSLLHRLFG
jgi:pilus assembly protein CpaE